MTIQLTLKQLRYLCTLAKTCHFGEAAEKCHVSQSTLSAAITELEEHLAATETADMVEQFPNGLFRIRFLHGRKQCGRFVLSNDAPDRENPLRLIGLEVELHVFFADRTHQHGHIL